MFSPGIHDLAQRIIDGYSEKKWKIVTAESCTAGLVAAALTDISGSSNVVERGFITYSNDAKVEVLAVLPETIEEFGAVSEQTAEAMAQGALEFSLADVAISVTGIAGPSGGSTYKPVGMVCFGVATRTGALFHYKAQFSGDRSDIREQATHEALKLLMSFVDEGKDELYR
ncbi:MAG TPA: CinA family protein [Alphaproteobacteria bacterium]|nr:CinA family protein [Alphaproteobacteria bacterium]